METPTIDEYDIVRHGGRWVALGPVEARVARPLIENLGAVVPRGQLEAVAWPDQPVRPNTTDRAMHRLRAHLAVLGLALVTVRGHGYLLEAAANLTSDTLR